MRQSSSQSSQQPSQPQQPQTLLSSARLKELLASVAENEVMDPLVETALLRMADEFAVDVCKAAVELASHRRANVLSVKDVAFVLDNDYNITVPGFDVDGAAGGSAVAAGEEGPTTGAGSRRKSSRTGTDAQVDAHASRMAKLRSHGRY